MNIIMQTGNVSEDSIVAPGSGADQKKQSLSIPGGTFELLLSELSRSLMPQQVLVQETGSGNEKISEGGKAAGELLGVQTAAKTYSVSLSQTVLQLDASADINGNNLFGQGVSVPKADKEIVSKAFTQQPDFENAKAKASGNTQGSESATVVQTDVKKYPSSLPQAVPQSDAQTEAGISNLLGQKETAASSTATSTNNGTADNASSSSLRRQFGLAAEIAGTEGAGHGSGPDDGLIGKAVRKFMDAESTVGPQGNMPAIHEQRRPVSPGDAKKVFNHSTLELRDIITPADSNIKDEAASPFQVIKLPAREQMQFRSEKTESVSEGHLPDIAANKNDESLKPARPAEMPASPEHAAESPDRIAASTAKEGYAESGNSVLIPQVTNASAQVRSIAPEQSSHVNKINIMPEPLHIQGNRLLITRHDKSSLEVSLHPEGLGKLDIGLVLEKGVLHAQIQASHPAGKDFVERNVSDIMNALAQDGIMVGGFSISLKNGESGWERNAGGNTGNKCEHNMPAADYQTGPAVREDAILSIFV